VLILGQQTSLLTGSQIGKSLTLTVPCLYNPYNDLQFLMSTHLPNDPSLNRQGIGSSEFAKQKSSRNGIIETFIVNKQKTTDLSITQLCCRNVMRGKRVLK